MLALQCELLVRSIMHSELSFTFKLRMECNMVKGSKYKLLVFVVIIGLLFAFAAPNMVLGQVESVSKVNEALDQISDSEKAILEELFFLTQEIEKMAREEAKIGEDIEVIKNQIKDLELSIAIRQKNYDEQLKALEKVLVSYQRMGPLSFLETILSSENMAEFLRSINTIRELTHNTGKLLASIEDEKNKLNQEKEALNEKVSDLEKKRAELNEALNMKLQLKAQQEAYLDSLNEEKEYYEKQLRLLEKQWGDLKSLFSKIVEEFANMMREGYLTERDFDITFSLTSIKGSITDYRLNDVIASYKRLPKMLFKFTKGKVELDIPESHLKLSGTFSLINGSTMKFEVDEGYFYDMPLEAASIDELFRNGYLLIELADITGGISIQSVNIYDGFIEFKVSPFF